MDIVYFNTKTVSKPILNAFIKSFNETFEMELEEDYFLQKYLKTPKGHSYHAYVIDENKVVGACNVVPYEYYEHEEVKVFGLLTDIFIMDTHRSNPFLLLKLMNALETQLMKEDINFLMAVPNVNSYPYLKKIGKWKDIGSIPYYCLPVKVGNVLKKLQISNPFSKIFSHVLLGFGNAFSAVVNSSEKTKVYNLVKDNATFESHRFYDHHKKIKTDDVVVYYRMFDEDGVATCYLLDYFDDEKKKNAKALNKACRYLLKNENADLILYVGEIPFAQNSLIKVPKKYEPKPLNFVGKVLKEEAVSELAFDINNWNFGLLNYDVR